MSGEGDGTVDENDGGGTDYGGEGGDIEAILAYLRQSSFGNNGDYTDHAGYDGDNTGPYGSKPPPDDDTPPETLIDILTIQREDMRGSQTRSDGGSRSAAEPYGGVEKAGALSSFLGKDFDPFSGQAWGAESPDPFSGLAFSDPFMEEWPDRVRSVTAPFAALRPPSLLSSPGLLADNDVRACDPNRTTCLPPMRSDAGDTVLQAEMNNSYVAILALMEGKAAVVETAKVNMQQIAATAAELANSDDYQLAYKVNQLHEHPLEIKHSAALTGLGHVVSGTLVATASGFIIVGSEGLALPLGATGLAAGVAEAQSGFALALSGADSTETVRMSGQLDYVFALTSSPASLVFGTTGLVITGGDVDISQRFALAGGIAEGFASFRGDLSKLYAKILPGVSTKAEKAGSTLLVKDVAALGFTARGPSVDVAFSKLNTNFTVEDLQAIQAFREQLAINPYRLDLAGTAAHAAAEAAPHGVDILKYKGAFQQELKFHGPFTGIYPQQLDSAATQGLNYSIKYQLEGRAIGNQLVPIRSVKHFYINSDEALKFTK